MRKIPIQSPHSRVHRRMVAWLSPHTLMGSKGQQEPNVDGGCGEWEGAWYIL